jgi:7,8-dihydropterin-6-yl-methyl-4-(beta-D-ribofuranosyl)aminobenzene 5'-phosphate synthase
MKERQPLRPLHKVDKLAITVITDNYYDALRQDAGPATRYRTRPGASVHAEHGLSYFVQTVAEGRTSSFMFDYGADAGGVLNNIRALDIDFGAVDALGLSHGHHDHWGGLTEILKQNGSRIRKDTPLYLGEEAFAHRFALRPSGELNDIGRLDRAEIEGTGAVRIVEIDGPTQIVPGAYLCGPIERVTEYEHVPSSLLIERDGKLEQDQFYGEQAIAFVVKGKGLVVLSGCAHAGVVNTVRHAQKITGVSRLHALLGGFHLVNAPPETIEATVADIKAMSPDYVVPAHCTGFEATVRLREEMAGRFILNTAGTRYVFGG